jgi:hypothetical protein
MHIAACRNAFYTLTPELTDDSCNEYTTIFLTKHIGKWHDETKAGHNVYYLFLGVTYNHGILFNE